MLITINKLRRRISFLMTALWLCGSLIPTIVRADDHPAASAPVQYA